MTIRHIALFALVAAGIGLFAWQELQPRGPLRAPEESAPQTGDAEPAPESMPVEETITASHRRLGPFSMQNNSYVVVLHEMPRAPGSTEETGTTVTSMEIQDATGEVQYRRAFSDTSAVDGFSDAWIVSAQRISGASGSGLLLTYQFDSEPSAPTPEDTAWYQLFGVINGQLRPFSGPVSVQGSLIPPTSESDLLEFKVWARHFRLVFPISVDWETGRLSPSVLCDTCEYQVLPEDLSRREDLTFVLMCPSPEPQCATPDRALVRRDSMIELVAVRAGLLWSEGSPTTAPADAADSLPDEGEISVNGDVWLKILIDGKEGWLHNEEDFLALTLPFEQ